MSKPYTIVDSSDPSTVLVIPPNEQMLAIARLYLEKYELLSERDRELYREAIASFRKGTSQYYPGVEVKQ